MAIVGQTQYGVVTGLFPSYYGGFVNLDDDIDASDSLATVFAKALSESIEVSESIAKMISKLYNEVPCAQFGISQFGTTSAFTNGQSCTYPDVSESLAMAFAKVLSESVTASDTLEKTIQLLKQESIEVAELVLKTLSKVIEDSIDTTDPLAIHTTKTLSESLEVSDVVEKLIGVLKTESITVDDSDLTWILPITLTLLSRVLTLTTKER